MNKKYFSISLLLLLFALVIFPAGIVFGDELSGTPRGNDVSGVVRLDNPIGETMPSVIIGRVISQALGIVGSIALLIFVYGGVIWMTAAGNDQQITKGKNILMWATIGIVFIFSSYLLVRFVLESIGAPEVL